MDNGLTNGHAPSPEADQIGPQRFANVAASLEIPIYGGEDQETVEVDLIDLQPDPTELCSLLDNENAQHTYWTTVALAYAKTGDFDTAIEVVRRSLDTVARRDSADKLPMYNSLCWLYLFKSREAPRTRLDAKADSELKTKDYYLRAATTTLNEASRINPSYNPLHLARGVLSLLRAALISDPNEKADALRQATKSFEDSIRTSNERNMMAFLGRARALFSRGQYAKALDDYQRVLRLAPDMKDPDPRIGIGCCFWAAGHKEDAHVAWQRALEINPKSTIANVLLGIYNLNASAQYSTSDPQFASLYKKAMVQYIQEAFKLDNKLPLACANFGSYFLVKKGMAQVETLAKKAVELTDVNSIASDGWYLLARKEHYGEELTKAGDYYLRADQARGGDERGYLPARFGGAQIRVLQGDPDGAKFRLEKIVQQSKSVEAMTLLGTLWAEDAFTGRAGNSKEELIAAQRRAIPLLEQVRMAWKDPKRNAQPDASVLQNLARLYEAESPEKALQCLQQVEQMELDQVDEDLLPAEATDEAARLAAMRDHLQPQLLNNIACFHFQAERLVSARDMFQAALNACVKRGEEDPSMNTDALVTTISFNLARTYEAENMLDEAKQVYEGLLTRHSEYLDAKMRLTYIALRQNPNDEGPKAMAQLYDSESTNLDVRSLYGWYLRKAKRRTGNVAEDQEQRHYKHTLQGHDKHDRYSLTAMGNLYLTIARDMKRDTEQERDRRRKMYEKAVEFFEKALQLDPRNAYAAQGIAIALVEDKKEFTTGLQIFSKIRETLKDASVYINLGHTYCEVKQYARAIEAYDAALAQSSSADPQILACLGRAWLLRGKAEKSPLGLRNSLEFSRRALESAPDQPHFKFNVAFVQIQLAQTLYALDSHQRSLEEVESAALDLDEAIDILTEIAKAPNPPFPRNDIEQRAMMARNTNKRQLERAIQAQREYESKNAARLAQARSAREADIHRRQEEKRKTEEAAAALREQVALERQKMAERDTMLARQREEEDARKREEVSHDEGEGSEKRERRRKGPSKRKKKGDEAQSDVDGTDGDVGRSGTPGSDRPRSKKKRRLERKSAGASKYKSEEFIVDDDEDLDELPAGGDSTPAMDDARSDAEEEPMDTTADRDAVAASAPRKRPNRVIDDDSDEGEEEVADPAAVADANGGDAASGSAAEEDED